MNRKTLEELAAGHALGALDSSEAAELERLLAHDEKTRDEVAAFMDVAAAMAAGASPAVTPSTETRARILAAVAATTQARRVDAPACGQKGFRVTPRSESAWIETGLPGFRMKVLSGSPDAPYQLILAELAAGGRIPEHDHHGTEELFILSGHLHTEGYVLGPGDFFRAEAGTHHRELTSPDGCTAILINGAVAPGK
jgi:anti-sigma factor ChrR (cupin superfamily)